MTNSLKPLAYTCDDTGITFPKIYKINHPGKSEYSLTPQTQVFSDMKGRIGVEISCLGPNSGVDLHLSYFDCKTQASGFAHASKYWNNSRNADVCQFNLEGRHFVLVTVRSESAKNRIHFNTFKESQEWPLKAIFNEDGNCVQHPSDH